MIVLYKRTSMNILILISETKRSLETRQVLSLNKLILQCCIVLITIVLTMADETFAVQGISECKND